MLSQVILGASLLGAEWVLYFLVILSIFSIALIVEKVLFFRNASLNLSEFRSQVRKALDSGKLSEAKAAAEKRKSADIETEMVMTLISQIEKSGSSTTSTLNELAQDVVLRGRLRLECRLAVLATIGSNALFVGLFGTVLGIMKAFHDLSQQAGAAAQTVTSGISESLVATTVGLFVALPAAVAYNLFQRKVKVALTEAEALKCYVIGKLVK